MLNITYNCPLQNLKIQNQMKTFRSKCNLFSGDIKINPLRGLVTKCIKIDFLAFTAFFLGCATIHS